MKLKTKKLEDVEPIQRSTRDALRKSGATARVLGPARKVKTK